VTAYSAARPPSTNTIALPPYPWCVLRFCNSVTSPPVSSVSDTAAETAIDGDPKSRAGARTVAFPADIVPELADHLERFADPTLNGFVFIGPKGGRLRRSNFRETWYRARGAVGLPELHFHDLGWEHDGGRAGRQPQGADGADGPLKPARRTHIYLHATRERDQKIAAGMGRLFADAKTRSTKRTGTDPETSGTQRARRPKKTPAATREN
jgi:hypothetical protein